MFLIQEHIDKMLSLYTVEGEFYSDIKDAKEEYASVTAKFDEDSSEYEGRMQSFNDWFLFNYKRKSDGKKLVDLYIETHDLSNDLKKSFYNITYSLFTYVKNKKNSQIVLIDLYNGDEIILSENREGFSIVKNDLFIGRVIQNKTETYLLKGKCFLPNNIIGHMKKELSKHKQLTQKNELSLFLTLESLKIKSIHYSHVSSEKIFQLNSF